jgi:hypothetical protein
MFNVNKVFRQTFEFGAKPIVITSDKLIVKEILDLIYEFIQFVKYDFNSDIHLSSGYLFSDAKVNTPVLLTKEFCEYLKLNYFNAISPANKFMPFRYTDREILSHELDGEIVINKEIVVKTSPLILDTKVLLQAYIVDGIYSTLKKSKIEGFLIQSGNFFLADNKKFWDIKFELEDDLIYRTRIKNSCIGFHFLHDYMINKKTPAGFVNIDEVINPKYVIFETETALENKIKSFDFKDYGLKSEFKTYALERKVEVIVFDKNDSEFVFRKDRVIR